MIDLLIPLVLLVVLGGPFILLVLGVNERDERKAAEKAAEEEARDRRQAQYLAEELEGRR